MRSWIELSQDAFLRNIHTIDTVIPQTVERCFVVKANAYGHGIEPMVKMALAHGLRTFAVDSCEEGLRVRAMSPEARIVVIGYLPSEMYLEALQARLEITVFDREQIRALNEAAKARGETARIHVKFETGLMRLGVDENDLSRFVTELKGLKNLTVVGMSTHFATMKSQPDDLRFPTYQMERFTHGVNELLKHGIGEGAMRHAASSASAILYPQFHFDMVRLGIALYGLWSTDEVETTARRRGMSIEFSPVLRFKTRVAQVRDVQPGTGIGYGLTERFTRIGRIAVLPVGYSDGLPWGLSSKGAVLIKGHSCPVVGRVCMNMMMVDVSNVPTVRKEEEVILLGTSGAKTMEAEDIGKRCGSHGYEVLARLPTHIPRLVIQSSSQTSS